MFIRQTNVHYMVPMFEQLGQSYTEMILPLQLQVACMKQIPKTYLTFNLQLKPTLQYSQLATAYLICYSKTIFKTQAVIHPSKTNFQGIFSYKQVLNFKKLNEMLRTKTPQTKNHTKRRKSVCEQIEILSTSCNICNNILFHIQLLASAMFRTVKEKQITLR